MKEVVIIDALRTPIGKYKGALSEVSAVELGTQVTKALLKRNNKIKSAIQQVIFGNVIQAGNGQNPARQIAVNSGISVEVPASTINEVCGSGMKAVILARQLIQLGEAEIVLAGGTESMSQAPKLLPYQTDGTYGEAISSMLQDGLIDSFSGNHMGITAENVAENYQVSRETQDLFAYHSQMKAAAAKKTGRFTKEIVPLTVGTGIVNEDEGIRPSTTVEKLAELRTVFKENGTVTAGNASTLNDGASALLLASKSYADANDLPYLAVIKDAVEVGIDPSIMGISPIKAINKLLERNQLSISDIDLFEINEAFASSSSVVEQQLGLDPAKVNIYGGGISLGHAIGATGARILTTLSYQLIDHQKQYGVASLCIGGGLGLAVLLERSNESKGKFYELSPEERLAKLVREKKVSPETKLEFEKAGLDTAIANHLIENQIGDFSIPLGVALNLSVNEKKYVVPMATEEPSVIAACSNGGKLCGDFQGEIQQRLMRGQIVFQEVENPEEVRTEIEARQAEIKEKAAASYPSIIKRGGGLHSLTTRQVGTFVSVDLLIDVKDAMGANIVNTILEGVATTFRDWFPEEDILFSILSNYATESLVNVSCRIPVDRLAKKNGKAVAEKIAAASQYAALDPYRAVTHNKGIMNGINGVVLATGNDTRAVAAGCHAYAARNGSYQGLSHWQVEGDFLLGTIELPLAIATVGGATRVLPKAQAALALLDVQSAEELAQVIAAVGLAQNLAALRALVTEGIQQGHMSLQARSLALSVGAIGNEIVRLSDQLQQEPIMNQETAVKLLTQLRK
ncbi:MULTISPECIES: hydroxymethylglutaryl-CoA reductase, degradative [Enterococcus]|uniref:hydroxymethylglutaryl-CoA reductase, degradative n=1 Tax=Enterococcus TaxID=1350 RepID=UPI0010F66E84|nr:MULTISPECIES: hydroxymethylglutaryl-CoA reductase, degradative [Enterococcus]